MMNTHGLHKEVNWDYCNYCEHKDLGQEQEPCHECLNYPSNNYSHKPVKYKGSKEIILDDY